MLLAYKEPTDETPLQPIKQETGDALAAPREEAKGMYT